jgi:anhydro-N-acetylmuramic acid kinase
VRVIGCMSGTSYDAVDAAVVDLELSGDEVRAHLVGELSVPVPDALRRRIAAALPPAPTTVDEVCRLDTEIGQLVGEVAAEARDLHGGTADLVVSSGQTVFHWVEGDRALGTLQLGAAAWVAERVGVPVVSDLRTRDITRGGQGAPLVSLFDALFVLPGGPGRAALNLGGIANLTVAQPDGSALAWDVGPANALVDAVVHDRTDGRESMDTGGARAARGEVDERLLAELQTEPFYALPPPKSTGKELFHLDHVRARLDRPVGDDDLVATLVELTAVTVGDAVRAFDVQEVIASGGGTRNPVLMSRLAARCAPARLRTIDELGVPSQAKEAMAFALMGFLTVHGLAGTVPGATGAKEPSVLGSVTPGRTPLRLPPPATETPRRLVLV